MITKCPVYAVDFFKGVFIPGGIFLRSMFLSNLETARLQYFIPRHAEAIHSVLESALLDTEKLAGKMSTSCNIGHATTNADHNAVHWNRTFGQQHLPLSRTRNLRTMPK